MFAFLRTQMGLKLQFCKVSENCVCFRDEFAFGKKCIRDFSISFTELKVRLEALTFEVKGPELRTIKVMKMKIKEDGEP